MSDYPAYVDLDDRPPFTIESVPDEVLEEAIGIAVSYSGCPECGTEQFHPMIPGHNSTWDCIECGFSMRIVG